MPWRKMDFPSAKEIKARTNCFVAKTFYFWVYIIRTSLPISFCYHYQYKFKIWKYNIYELENTLQDSCFFLSTLQDSFKKALLRFYERPLPWKASFSRPRTWHLCHRKSHRIVCSSLEDWPDCCHERHLGMKCCGENLFPTMAKLDLITQELMTL